MGEPAWIRTVEEDQATGKVKQIYEQVERAKGSSFNIRRAASLWPELMDIQDSEFQLFTSDETRLKSDIKDLVAAHVAGLNNCVYCADGYRSALRLRGWSDEKITHILQDIESDHLSREDRAILVFADKITRKPQSMSREDIETLRHSGLDDRMILEAAALTGFINYMTRLANALGVMTEAGL